MSPPNDAEEITSLVQAALDEYRESWMDGNRLDPEVYCREHSECGDVLLEKIKDFLFVAEGLPHADGLKGRDPVDESGTISADTGRILGDFHIIREIGRGGMGTVYEAEQISLRRKVALKILPRHLGFSKDAVMKFQREAEAGGRQRHPGIVAVHAVGEHEGTYYIAQELLEGGRTLGDRIEEVLKVGEPPQGYFRETALLFARIAEALQHAHEKGVIHRDVKPSNILLTPEGAPKVTDFGLAKVENAMALSKTGDFSGTPYYMSPEQVSRRRMRLDHRTDVFSLGVTLYESLTFARPFEGDTSHEVLKKILVHDPRDPRRVNPRVPHDLAVICLKAMEKDPEKRYPTMEAFGEDFRLFLSGEVIKARPAGIRDHAWKWIKRNPAVSAPLGVALLAIMIFIGYVLLWSYPRIKMEKDNALAAQKAEETEKLRALAAEKKAEEERVRAEEEAEKARFEAATAEALQQFLIGLFNSPDPVHARGTEITAREILDRGLERIEQEFEDRFDIKTRLLITMGNVYRHLGAYSVAESLFEQALEVRCAHLAPDHPDVLAAQYELGRLYGYQDRISAAAALLEHVVEGRRRVLGDDHTDTLMAMNSLAFVYMNNGQYEESGLLLQEALEGRRQRLGENHEDTINSMMGLGILCMRKGLLDKAEPLLLEAYRRSCINDGDDSWGSKDKADELAALYIEQGRYDDAESLIVRSLELCRRLFGNDHPETLSALNRMSEVCLVRGRCEEAESLLKEVLDSMRRTYGNEHSETLSTLITLARLYLDQSRYREAEPLLHEALQRCPQTFGKEHALTLSAMNNLANVYANSGRYEEAESLHLEILEIRRRKLGNEHPKTLISMNNLASLYFSCNRIEDAEDLFQEVLESRRRILGNEHSVTCASMNNLAMLYKQQGRFEDSESLVHEALEVQRRVLGNDHCQTLGSRNTLARLSLQQGDFKKAEPLCREAFEEYRRVFGLKYPDTLVTLHHLTFVHFKLGHYKEAESLARELLEHTPKDDRYYRDRAALLKQIEANCKAMQD